MEGAALKLDTAGHRWKRVGFESLASTMGTVMEEEYTLGLTFRELSEGEGTIM